MMEPSQNPPPSALAFLKGRIAQDRAQDSETIAQLLNELEMHRAALAEKAKRIAELESATPKPEGS
jgi:hypothetical protein